MFTMNVQLNVQGVTSMVHLINYKLHFITCKIRRCYLLQSWDIER